MRHLETDGDGCAAFEVSEKKDYEIHIMKSPDGYTFDKEEIFATILSCLTVSLFLFFS